MPGLSFLFINLAAPPFPLRSALLVQRESSPLFRSRRSLQMFGTLSVSAGSSLSTVGLSKSGCPPLRSSGRRRNTVVTSAVAGTIGAPRTASLYEILQVKETASPVEIKTAYRSLAKRFHPDAATAQISDSRDFIQIHNAYATLSDPTARAQYDRTIGPPSFLRDSHRRYGSAPAWNDMRFRSRRWETDQCW